jgi:oligosaccharide repeat unit polymerase
MVILGLAVTWVSAIPIVWLLMLLAAGLATVPFVVAAVRHEFDVFEPVYLFSLSYFVLFGVHPAVETILSANSPVFVGYALDPTYATALIIGAVGATLFYLGYYLPLGGGIAQRIALPRQEWSPTSLTAFVIISIVVALAAFAIFLVSNGGSSILAALLSGRNSVSGTVLRESSGYLSSAPLWLAPIGILLITLPHRRWFGSLFGLLLLTLSQLLTAGLGDRSWTLPTVAAVFLVWYLRRGRRPSALVVVVALAFVFFFGITVPRQYRNTDARAQPLSQLLLEDALHPGQGIQDFFAGLDTAMVDGLAVELQFVPNSIDYQMGRTYLEAASRPVPRAIWADKPRAAETQLMAAIWPQFASAGVGFSFSLFGEPYLNFGLFGVIALFLAFGVFWRAAYAWFRRAPMNPFVISLYALSWPFLFVYMRGGLGIDYQRQVIYLLPILLAYLFVRRSRIAPPSTVLRQPFRTNSFALDSVTHR